jgi:hypothetical protein
MVRYAVDCPEDCASSVVPIDIDGQIWNFLNISTLYILNFDSFVYIGQTITLFILFKI